MKMYETWYTYKDMKQILGFINESKDMANMANDEKATQKVCSLLFNNFFYLDIIKLHNSQLKIIIKIIECITVIFLIIYTH